MIAADAMVERPGREAAERLEGTAPAIVALRDQIRRPAVFDAVGGIMVPTVAGETCCSEHFRDISAPAGAGAAA